MKNQAFLRAVNCLSHPVSIGAIFLLLLNDQVLRRAWPSWWTGKLGDFAWLIFVPFIVVAILAWMVPFRLKHRKETIGLLAFALTGVWFALAKTVPAVHDVTVRCFETITGWKASLLLDPTDLMALTALSIGWYVWRHKQVRPLKISRTVWPVLALASLAIVADAAAPDVGIECLERRDSRLIAFSKYFGTYSQVFSSDDGGLSWQEAPSYRDSQLECTGHDHSWQVGDDTGRIQYLFEPGIGISSSEDSGKTWKRVVDLAGREARDAYYVHSRPNSWSISGPSDALIHDSTGNLVVAMGQDGVLVRTSDAQWRWVSVGPYRHEELNRIDQIWTLIYGEFWLSVLFALLLVSMLVLGWRCDRFACSPFWLRKCFALAYTRVCATCIAFGARRSLATRSPISANCDTSRCNSSDGNVCFSAALHTVESRSDPSLSNCDDHSTRIGCDSFGGRVLVCETIMEHLA
jgi:hypothetical protein